MKEKEEGKFLFEDENRRGNVDFESNQGLFFLSCP
jgi:hypothetical protein